MKKIFLTIFCLLSFGCAARQNTPPPAIEFSVIPADSPVRPQLEQIVGVIGRVIEEGRNTVQGLRAANGGDFTDLERQFSELRHELDTTGRTDFRIVTEGAPKALSPAIADEIYHIRREALINAFRHSKAARIEVAMQYAARDFRLVGGDDGIGIKPQIVQSGREKHWGLSGMKERAEKIGAQFKVLSRAETGTEIELAVPNHVAFKTRWSNGSRNLRASDKVKEKTNEGQ